MDLIALEPERVRFTGLRERHGLMTLGQLNFLEWITRPGISVDARLEWVLDLPNDVLVSDITETLAVMLTRHEGLRTTYMATEPPVQRTVAEGELVIAAFAMAQGEPSTPDRDSLSMELLHRLRTDDATASESLPLQVALVRHENRVLAAAALCSHLAVDFHASALINREFAELVRDPRARAAAKPAVCQPLDRALAEQEPHARRRLAAAIVRWERHLARMPKQVYVGPRCTHTGESAAVLMTSPAAGLALDQIAQRTGRSRVAVVFALVCIVISQRTGYERWSGVLMSGNRFEPSLTEYIGAMSQSAAVDIDVRGDGLDELIGRVADATFTAYRHGLYNVYDRRAAQDRIGTSRGIDFCMDPLFNGVDSGRPAMQGDDPGELEAPSAEGDATRLEWMRMPPTEALIKFDMRPAHRALKLQCWTGDTARTSRPEMESLLLAIERLMVAAAAHDLNRDQMQQVSGVKPLTRGADWLLIDHCWIELSEVQRLLKDALPSVSSQIFHSIEDRALVAYIPAGPQAQTPEQAHARCLTQLLGRPSAMTPRWYVICDGTPDDPADVSAWRNHAVLAQGPGRVL